MAVDTRLATPADLEALTALAQAMERGYGDVEMVDDATARQRIEAALFGALPAALAFVADAGGRSAGFAFVNRHFPAEAHNQSLYLKDLFVDAGMRRRGVAAALLAAVVHYAQAHGFSRVDWNAMPDNDPANTLYRALGAGEMERVSYRVEAADFARFLRAADRRD